MSRAELGFQETLLSEVVSHYADAEAAASKFYEQVEREVGAGRLDDGRLRRIYEAAAGAGDGTRADLVLRLKARLSTTTTWGVWVRLDWVPTPSAEEQLRMNLAEEIGELPRRRREEQRRPPAAGSGESTTAAVWAPPFSFGDFRLPFVGFETFTAAASSFLSAFQLPSSLPSLVLPLPVLQMPALERTAFPPFFLESWPTLPFFPFALEAAADTAKPVDG